MEKRKISLVLNSIIFGLVVIASIMMFVGFRFTSDQVILESSKFRMFKFFTVDSNLLMGLSALIMVIFNIISFRKKQNVIPKWGNILYQAATVGVGLTFFVTLFFLAPTISTGFLSLYTNSNFFFHLVIPVLSMITYVLFEKYDNKYVYAFFGLIPLFLYSIFYFGNILFHIENGVVNYGYDFYNFLNGNIHAAPMVGILMFVATYILSLFLIALNKKLK